MLHQLDRVYISSKCLPFVLCGKHLIVKMLVNKL